MKQLLFLKPRCLWLILGLAIGLQQARAQCSGCTTTYASSTASNITVSTGQTICVNSGVTMSGVISMNGGVLCNSGTVGNLKLNGGKGTIKNFGTIKDGETTISFGGTTFIYCFASSQFSFASVSISMGTSDSLYFNLASGASMNFANDLSVSSRKLSIVNTGTFTIRNNLSVNNAGLLLYNTSGGSFIVSNSISLTNTTNKTISNSGSIQVANALSVGGSGSGATVLIDNNNSLSVTKSLECTMTGGTFNLNNNVSSTAGVNIGLDLTLTSSSDVVTNRGMLAVGRDINTNSGSISNSNTLTCAGNFTVSGGTYTNYLKSTIQGNLIVSSSSKVNAYGLIEVKTDFKNTGKFKMGQQALLKTKNYYNTGTDTLFGAPTSITDTALYARIWISNHSENSGPLRDRVMIYDEALTPSAGNIEYGFDTVANTGSIGSTVLYVAKTISPGSSIVISIPVKMKFFTVLAQANVSTVGCGTAVNLSAAFYAPYSIFNPAGPSYSPTYFDPGLPGSAYTWQPGSLSGPTQAVTPTASTTYDLSVTYLGSVYTAQVNVTVIPITVSTGGSAISFAMPDAASLTATPSGGSSPYTYNWQPNLFFVNSTTNTQQNPQVSPPTSLTYTVSITDANGCPATATVNVIAEPYAHLRKIPDGGYYKLFDNKLLFKYDGQYATTALVCNIYDKTNTAVTSGSFSSLVVNSGDNRYYYNATSLSTGYYTMEVVNEKNEKLYLRFKR